MGALVGALFAAGHTIPEIEQICRREMVERNPMNDYTLPVSGLIRRHKGEEMLRRMYGEQQIEALPRGYFCVSADLIAGELVVHSVGDVYRAVGASVCLPGVSPPVPDEGRLLVDGGLLDNLPVEAMATTMEGPVIAVDVSGRYVPRARGARRPRARRLEARLRRAVVGEEAPLPTLAETLYRTVVLGSTDTAEAAQRHAALVIEPEVSEFGLTGFEEIERISAAGRAAVERSLAGGAPLWLLDETGDGAPR
jgi:NTE family protein